MNKLYVIGATAMLGVAMAGAASAQGTEFPTERSQPASCDAVKWNADMLRDHPTLIEACREVVVADGQTWARFDARFVRAEPEGPVIFSVRDQNDRTIEEVRLIPADDQVAYINGNATPFRQLRSTDTISLYVPEGQYGFATKPGVPREQLAVIVPATTTPATRSPAPVPAQPAAMVAQQKAALPAVLPTTAGPLPLVALGGLLSLLGGLGLTLRRRS